MPFKNTLSLPALIICLLSPGCATNTPPPEQKVAKYEDLIGTWKPILVQTKKEVNRKIPTHYLVFTESQTMRRIEPSDGEAKIVEKEVGLREDGVLVAQFSEVSEMYGPIARVRFESDRMIVQGAVDEIVIYDRISRSSDMADMDLKKEFLPVKKIDL
jgi:hypothetical protein